MNSFPPKVSHSWSDSPEQKFRALQLIAAPRREIGETGRRGWCFVGWLFFFEKKYPEGFRMKSLANVLKVYEDDILSTCNILYTFTSLYIKHHSGLLAISFNTAMWPLL